MTPNNPTGREYPKDARDLVGYGRSKPEFEWPGGNRLALNFVINYEEGSEYTVIGGDERNDGLSELPHALKAPFRDIAGESMYEYGSRAGVWRLTGLFEEYGIDATVFACAVAVERNTEFAAWLREGQVDVCCHGWRWTEQWLYTREQEAERMIWALDSLEKTTGRRPRGWYCRYGPSENTRSLVIDTQGLDYDSDYYGDDLPFFVDHSAGRHLVIPYSLTYNDMKFTMPYGSASPSAFVDLCTRAIDEYLIEGERGTPKMMSIGLHCRLAGQAGRASAIREIIEYAKERSVWIVSRETIADWWVSRDERIG